MTKTDLKILFKQETGKDAIENIALEFTEPIEDSDVREIQQYLDWVTEKLINLYNL